MNKKGVFIIAVICSLVALQFYRVYDNYYQELYRMYRWQYYYTNIMYAKWAVSKIPRDNCTDLRPANDGGVIMSLKENCTEGFFYPPFGDYEP
jgi:hypothetical protein